MSYKTYRKGELPQDYDTMALDEGEVAAIDPTDPFDPVDPWDPEIFDLILAMNDLPGIETFESCSGHGKAGAAIYFTVKEGDQRGLFVLARSVSRNYWLHCDDWLLRVDVQDVPVSPLPIVYILESLKKGRKAYQQALDLAQNIVEHLEHDAFLEQYGLQDLRL